MISLRHKLWIGFGGLLAVLIIVTVLTVVVLTRYSQVVTRIFRENYDSAVYCNGMRASLDDLNGRALRVLWNDAGANQVDITGQQENFENNLDSQIRNSSMPGEMERSRHLEHLWGEYRNLYTRFQSTSEAKARVELYHQELLPRFEVMKQLALQITDMNVGNMAAVDGKVKMTLLHVSNALLLLVITGAIVAGVVIWAAGAAVVRALATVTRSAHQIAAGDLDLSLTIHAKDEIGQIGEALNTMAAGLREFRRVDHDRLVRSQQTTQLAIDSLPDAVFVIAPDGRIEISNLTAGTHFGIVPNSTVSELRLKWLTPLFESVKQDLKPVEPQGYKAAIQLFSDGEERFLLPRALPMLGEFQQLIGVTVILADITMLHRVDEAKSSVISTVSHELRTPLTGVRMSLSLLASDNFGPVTDDQRQLIAASREDGDRLYRIIDNLLNISRIEAGRSQFQFQPMRPADILTNAIDPLRLNFGEKKLALNVEIAGDLPNVMADAPSIGSAITNLLTNAIKFTPSDGKVTVRVEAQGRVVVFSVADNGPGIPEEYRHRMFEKFFRIPTKSGPKGAGLGLTIAKEIVEAHSGEIEFHCPPSGGTVFTISLPVSS